MLNKICGLVYTHSIITHRITRQCSVALFSGILSATSFLQPIWMKLSAKYYLFTHEQLRFSNMGSYTFMAIIF